MSELEGEALELLSYLVPHGMFACHPEFVYVNFFWKTPLLPLQNSQKTTENNFAIEISICVRTFHNTAGRRIKIWYNNAQTL